MHFRHVFLAASLSLLQAISATPNGKHHHPPALNNLTGPYTVTAYAPWNCEYNGLKVETWNLFESKVSSYCPFLGTSEANLCPNGTDMVLEGSLYPVSLFRQLFCTSPNRNSKVSLVAGGQDTYVNVDGLVAITVQHEHSIPPGAYWEYIGWNWTALPVHQPPVHDGSFDNPIYNCEPPTGYWDFKAPGALVGGVKACPNEYDNTTISIYAVTPAFNRTDCVALKGLGTHPYSGILPPVYAYY